MFELSDQLEVIAITDVGPEKRNCMLIDNFYKNPDEVRGNFVKNHQIRLVPRVFVKFSIK